MALELISALPLYNVVFVAQVDAFAGDEEDGVALVCLEHEAGFRGFDFGESGLCLIGHR